MGKRKCLTVASLSDVDIKNGVGCVKRYTSDWTHSFTSENLHSIRLYASLLLQRIISKQCNNLAIIFNKPLKIWVINESFGCLTVSKRLWASSDFHKKNRILSDQKPLWTSNNKRTGSVDYSFGIVSEQYLNISVRFQFHTHLTHCFLRSFIQWERTGQDNGPNCVNWTALNNQSKWLNLTTEPKKS